MPPIRAPKLAISFENEISVASSALDAYLIISAVRVLVRRRGTVVGKGAYSCLEDIRRSCIDSAEHEAVRKQEVADGRAFGEKLGIHAQSKICSAPLTGRSIQQRPHHFVGCARHHGALDHDHMVIIDPGKCGADVACRLADVADIDTLPVEGRADRDKRDLAPRGPPIARSVVALIALPTCRSSSSSSPASKIGLLRRSRTSILVLSTSTQIT